MPSLFRLSPPADPTTSRLQRDSIAFVLSDGRRIDVLRVRDPRARRLRLSVGERGPRLTLPPRVSLAAGERFLLEHRDWLTHQLAPREDDVQPLVPGEPGAVPLRGDRLALRWEGGRAARLLRGPGPGRHRPLAAGLPARPAAAAAADPAAGAVLAVGLAGPRRHPHPGPGPGAGTAERVPLRAGARTLPPGARRPLAR